MVRVRRVAVVGRFQPFHWGHFEYLLEGARRGQQLVIGISNPTVRERRFTRSDAARSTDAANPFSYEQRCLMISRSLERLAPHLTFSVTPCDLRSASLTRKSLGECDLVAMTIYDAWGEEKRVLLEAAGYEVMILWRRAEKLVSGKEVRRRIKAGEAWEHLVPSGAAAVIRNLRQAG